MNNNKVLYSVLIISIVLCIIFIMSYFGKKNNDNSNDNLNDIDSEINSIDNEEDYINDELLEKIKDKTVYQFENFIYNVPDGFEVEEYDNKMFKIKTNDWYTIITCLENKSNDYLNEVYDAYNEDAVEKNSTIYKDKIDNHDVVIVKFNGYNILFCFFISPNNYLYNIMTYYDAEEFDINNLDVIIDSLSNSINLE